MAIARIKATPRWFRAASESLAGSEPKAVRELLRAAERPGKTAELNEDEVRALATVRPRDPRVLTALSDLESSLARERARPRPRYYGV